MNRVRTPAAEKTHSEGTGQRGALPGSEHTVFLELEKEAEKQAE